MSKTTRQGATEIVKSVSVEEWTQLFTESMAAAAEGAAAVSELMNAFGATMNEVRVNVERFRERWAEINFTD